MKRRESFASFHAGKEKFNPLLPPPPFLLLHLSSDFFDWVFASSRYACKGERGKEAFEEAGIGIGERSSFSRTKREAVFV